jgi:hypothetical protein
MTKAQLEKALRRATRERNLALMDMHLPPVHHTRSLVGAGIGLTDGERAVATARAEWDLNVSETTPHGRDRIDHYIRSVEGLGWKWQAPYTENGQFAWCGAFIGYCWGQAGLTFDLRKRVMPSCYRIWKWASGTDRFLCSDHALLPGDLVIVGNDRSPRWGSHITICRARPEPSSSIPTFEGNAHGEGPDGTTREGVVRRFRPYQWQANDDRSYRFLYAVRFLEEDLDGS